MRFYMRNIVFASGTQIFDSAVEGAKRKYNRSTEDYSEYENMLNKFYEDMLNDKSNVELCKHVRKKTKNNCRNALFPMTILMLHKHRAMQPCETHARVCLMGNYSKVFDIPLEYWEMFESQSRESA